MNNLIIYKYNINIMYNLQVVILKNKMIII